ncbi:protein of unknown function [Flavobacteriaceae bacterium MAR_2010_188]|nr:protein of unknown function [Flavobacteriaceae bacterium MAR_2010_188]
MKNPYLYLILFLLFSIYGCVEEFDISTDSGSSLLAENALVVEATLTDSLQTQKITLTRAISFENDSIVEYDEEDPNSSLSIPQTRERPIAYERNARVQVESDEGKIFDFFEAQEGRYISVGKFKAEEGIAYRLLINRSNGDQISSEFETLIGKSTITSLRAQKGTNQAGDEGLFFYVDGESSQTNSTSYYRYDYEETFRIVAPLWSPLDFSPNLSIVPRVTESKTCFRTENSKEIIQLSTENISGANVNAFSVNFLPKSSYAIAFRYSIEVTQYLQDVDAYLYYDRLESFSKSSSVFYQVQPGFLKGNFQIENNTENLVVGYFSVVSVSKKRIFIDYLDFYTGEPETLFLVNCRFITSPHSPTRGCPPSVSEYVADGVISYYSVYNESFVPNAMCPGPYIYVPKICGDCTVLGSNVKPDFWID